MKIYQQFDSVEIVTDTNQITILFYLKFFHVCHCFQGQVLYNHFVALGDWLLSMLWPLVLPALATLTFFLQVSVSFLLSGTLHLLLPVPRSLPNLPNSFAQLALPHVPVLPSSGSLLFPKACQAPLLYALITPYSTCYSCSQLLVYQVISLMLVSDLGLVFP